MKFNISIFYFICIVTFVETSAKSDNTKDSSDILLRSELNKTISLGLNYLSKTQIKETKVGYYYRGEWQTKMCLQRGYFYLGKKREEFDSNCFSITSIHNSLANIYLLFPQHDNIIPMLNMSFDKILSYKSGNSFNFWNLLPPTRKLKRGDVIGQQPLVRRPTNFVLKSRYINNAANVANDADDTSLGYVCFALRNKIHQQTNLIDSVFFDKDSLSLIFENYRDLNRKNRHFYNHKVGKDYKTGAYLTWLSPEFEFKKWKSYKMIIHNVFMFLPFSQCYPHPYKTYVPYGCNDIDAVINANILSCLSLNNSIKGIGVDSAIKYIERKSKLEHYYLAGMYYPNSFQFPNAVCSAYANGAFQLENSVNNVVKYTISMQNKDGSWVSRKKLNNGDILQSTAYALKTLIDAGNYDKYNSLNSIKIGINYLLANAIIDENGVHWTSGVFFSAGSIVRNRLIWKSDAYTTAIILEAFAKFSKYLENK